MIMFQTGQSKEDSPRKKQWHIAKTRKPVLPLAQTVQVKEELGDWVSGLTDFRRRLHEEV